MSRLNTKKYWFKRRRYGYGWTPSTWQGWVAIGIFLGIIFLGTLVLKDTPRNTYSDELVAYFIMVFLGGTALLLTAYKRGPAPKWRWGKSKKDNPEEDF